MKSNRGGNLIEQRNEERGKEIFSQGKPNSHHFSQAISHLPTGPATRVAIPTVAAFSDHVTLHDEVGPRE